jgi:hypothetical protein
MYKTPDFITSLYLLEKMQKDKSITHIESQTLKMTVWTGLQRQNSYNAQKVLSKVSHRML